MELITSLSGLSCPICPAQSGLIIKIAIYSQKFITLKMWYINMFWSTEKKAYRIIRDRSGGWIYKAFVLNLNFCRNRAEVIGHLTDSASFSNAKATRQPAEISDSNPIWLSQILFFLRHGSDPVSVSNDLEHGGSWFSTFWKNKLYRPVRP